MPSEDLEQRLLDAPSPETSRVMETFSVVQPDLVDLVDVDDATFGALDVVIGILEKPEDDVLHVLAHVAGLRERRGVGNRKGHVEDPGQRAGQQGLAGPGRAGQQDVALLDLDVVELGRERRRVLRPLAGVEQDALVMIVDGDRQDLLGVLLADDEIVEDLLDLRRLDQADRRLRIHGRLLDLALDDQFFGRR